MSDTLGDLIEDLYAAKSAHAEAKTKAAEAWADVVAAKAAVSDALLDAGMSSARSESGVSVSMTERVSAKVDPSVDPEVIARGLADAGLGELVSRHAVVLPRSQTLAAEIRRARERVAADGEDPDMLVLPGIEVSTFVDVNVRRS